jgi:hypothetical protein
LPSKNPAEAGGKLGILPPASAHLLHDELYELPSIKTQKSLPYETQIENGEGLILGARSKHAALFNCPLLNILIHNKGQLKNKLNV